MNSIKRKRRAKRNNEHSILVGDRKRAERGAKEVGIGKEKASHFHPVTFKHYFETTIHT